MTSLTPDQPAWLLPVLAQLGEPDFHVRDSDMGGFLRTQWTWQVQGVEHMIRIDARYSYTEVVVSTHDEWKPDVSMDFGRDYGPSDRDMTLILRLSRFLDRERGAGVDTSA